MPDLTWTPYDGSYLPPGIYLVQYEHEDNLGYRADPTVFRTEFGGTDWLFDRYIDLTDLPGVEPPIENAARPTA